MNFLIAIKDTSEKSKNILETGLKIANAFSSDLSIIHVGKKSKAMIEGDVNLARTSLKEWNILHPGIEVLNWAYQQLKKNETITNVTDTELKPENYMHYTKRVTLNLPQISSKNIQLILREGDLVEELSIDIHEFKYEGNSNLAKYMGGYLGMKIKGVSELADVDCVSFVPMHPKKIKKRGYNQAEELAIGVAKKLNVKNQCVLNRSVESASQTEKGVYERYENMDANFTALHGFEGKHILLVDDVLTTGATLIACVNAIKEKYDVKVSVVRLAFRGVER